MHPLFYHQAITNILKAYFGINGTCPIPEFVKYSEVSSEHREENKTKQNTINKHKKTLFPPKPAHFLLKKKQSMQTFDRRKLDPVTFQILFSC